MDLQKIQKQMKKKEGKSMFKKINSFSQGAAFKANTALFSSCLLLWRFPVRFFAELN